MLPLHTIQQKVQVGSCLKLSPITDFACKCQVWDALPQLQLCLLLQPCSWSGQPSSASEGFFILHILSCSRLFSSGQDIPPFQDVKDIQKTDSNAEYYRQTESCRIKTYGFEQVLIQHRFLFQDVNCIEKSATNANSGAKDEAIVFTMRRGGKTFIFGQVVALLYSSPSPIMINRFQFRLC